MGILLAGVGTWSVRPENDVAADVNYAVWLENVAADVNYAVWLENFVA